MAKKSVASLQTGSKRLTKAIKMVKSEKSGAYTFVESIMAPEKVSDFLSKNKIFFIKSYLKLLYYKAAFIF
jgi:hypothetical protein